MPRSGKFNTDLTKSQKIPSTVEHIEKKSQQDHPKDVRLFRSASDSYYFLFFSFHKNRWQFKKTKLGTEHTFTFLVLPFYEELLMKKTI